MPKSKNAIWGFLASVKLALITLIILAAASILGTLIKQGQDPAYYVQEFGPTVAGILDFLGIPDMYGSWWFIALLSLFALNLVACSIERFPVAWQLVRLDNLAVGLEQLERQGFAGRVDTRLPSAATTDRLQQILKEAGWKNPRRRDRDGAALLFVQKYAWSRLGVYGVHLSILVIFAGAVTGSLFGFKAYVYLPEGRSTSEVFLQKTREPVPLGFELRCDGFQPLAFSAQGGIEGERADLTVLDPVSGTSLRKSIVVNDPLTYRGITFYKATSYPAEGFYVVLRNQATGQEQLFRAPAEQDVAWPGTTVSFRIEEVQRDAEGFSQQAKVLLKTGEHGETSAYLVKDNSTVIADVAAGPFSISVRQLYTILVLTTKDPGVWLVWVGSALMVVSLLVCFCLSHRRIWISVAARDKQGSRILVSGAVNKNRAAFERQFEAIVRAIQQDAALSPGAKG